MYLKSIFLLFLLSVFFTGCIQNKPTPKPKKFEAKKNILIVTSTAYTSCKRETDKTPYLAAWNNRLKPSVKSIAVSRDLLKLGLTNGTKVKISGLKGHYIVLDKMNKRWKKKIDIYMGCNLKKAKKWGKRKVTIVWDAKPKS